MSEELKRIDTSLIYPPLLEKLIGALRICNIKGARYVATAGFRSYNDQTNLWKQGRLTPGQIVTQARGGQSQHNFGLAVDFVRDVDTKTQKVEPGFKEEDYSILVVTMSGFPFSLHSGRAYHDSPHVGWPGFVSGISLRSLHSEWCAETGTDRERLAHVWRIVDNATKER